MEIGKTYKIFVTVGRNTLNFTGTIKSVKKNFVTFTDKFGLEYTYNLNNVISFEEIKNESTK